MRDNLWLLFGWPQIAGQKIENGRPRATLPRPFCACAASPPGRATEFCLEDTEKAGEMAGSNSRLGVQEFNL